VRILNEDNHDLLCEKEKVES